MIKIPLRHLYSKFVSSSTHEKNIRQRCAFGHESNRLVTSWYIIDNSECRRIGPHIYIHEGLRRLRCVLRASKRKQRAIRTREYTRKPMRRSKRGTRERGIYNLTIEIHREMCAMHSERKPKQLWGRLCLYTCFTAASIPYIINFYTYIQTMYMCYTSSTLTPDHPFFFLQSLSSPSYFLQPFFHDKK